MGQERITLGGQPEVLAAAQRGADRAAAECGAEIGRAGRVPPDGPRMQHLDLVDGAARDMLGQAPPDGLDLGKLRHGLAAPERLLSGRSPALVWRSCRHWAAPPAIRDAGQATAGRPALRDRPVLHDRRPVAGRTVAGRTVAGRTVAGRPGLGVGGEPGADRRPGGLGRLLPGFLLRPALALTVGAGADAHGRPEELLVVRAALLDVVLGHAQHLRGGELLE